MGICFIYVLIVSLRSLCYDYAAVCREMLKKLVKRRKSTGKGVNGCKSYPYAKLRLSKIEEAHAGSGYYLLKWNQQLIVEDFCTMWV